MKHYLSLLFLLLPLFTRAANLDSVELRPLAKGVWVHTSYLIFDGSPFPSNGLLVQTKDGLVLIDTPCNDAQTENLLKTCRSKFGVAPELAIVTHFHNDRLGGIRTLQAQGIRVVGKDKTAALAVKDGYPAPETFAAIDTTIQVSGTAIRLFYPGAAHSPDNIVVWLPQQRVLFGGCMVKALEAQGMGNVADADLHNWPLAVKQVQQQFPETEIVVPGHGRSGNKRLLEHTLRLLRRHK